MSRVDKKCMSKNTSENKQREKGSTNFYFLYVQVE